MLVQDSAEPYHSISIQAKPRHCRSAGWRHADDQREVVAPDEVLCPVVHARAVERRWLPTDWVGCFNFIIFVVVAPLASQRQILDRGGAALGAGDDMLNGEGLSGKPLLTVAVLTAAVRAFNDTLPQPAYDTLLRHARVALFPDCSSSSRGAALATEPVC